jgi:hypothetical protein
MLDGRDAGAIAVAEDRTERDAGDPALVRGDLGAVGMTVGEKKP